MGEILKNKTWLKLAAIVTCGILSFLTPALQAAEPSPSTLRVYFIGNSVTDIIGYRQLVAMAETRQQKLVWGRQMIPGAPLSWIHDHIDSGFSEPPFGKSTQAFSEFEWDILSLQPFDRALYGTTPSGKPDGDVQMSQVFIEMAVKKSPDIQVYIYSRWPRLTRNGKGFSYDKNAFDPTANKVDLAKLGEIDDFSDRWNQKWKGGITNETRDYFEKAVLELRKNMPNLKKPVLLVPVGDVMNALHQKMKAGEIPGFTSIYETYADGIHLNNIGRFIVGTTYYTTLFKTDPTGLSSVPYKVDNPEIVKIIQQTAWKIVSEHPHAGIHKPE